MLLGKRPRAPMRRTTSLTDFSFDLNAAVGPQTSDGEPKQPRHQRLAIAMEGVAAMDGSNNSTQQRPLLPHRVSQQKQQQQQQYQHLQPWGGTDTRLLLSMAPPSNPPRHSAEFVVRPAHFLRACGLCKRRLGPGKDTFMYRGEVAFCSLECRQQQMNLDERKEKCSLASMKRSPPKTATKSEASGDSEAAVAA